jgi:general secretion pathway protein G
MKNREKAVVSHSRKWPCRTMPVAPQEKCGATLCTWGFTLVELIAVLAIVMTLVIIAFPFFQRYAEKAKVYRCIADIHNMGTGIAAYGLENQNRLPDSLNDLSNIGLGNMKDPWGHPYVYYKFPADGTGKYMDISGIIPLNDDGFDLYSLGVDGATTKVLSAGITTSSDDVIRADNGNYIGKGEDYLAP